MRPLKASHPPRSHSGSLAALRPFPCSPAGDGRPSPPPCRGSRSPLSRLLRQRQVRGPSPAADRADLRGRETPRKTAKPPSRREGRAPRLREGSKFHLPRPGGIVPPLPSPPRNRCGLAEPELRFPGAASPCGPAEPASGADRALLGATDHWRRALRGSSPALVLGFFLLLFLFCFPPPSTHFP